MKNDSGQALLIAVMLIAVILTVVFTVAFTSRTDQQVSKLSEENQKALAAAEAGVEADIHKAVNTSETFSKIAGNDPKVFGAISGNVDILGTSGNEFLSPNLTPNQQFTFYLVDYNDGTFKNKNSQAYDGDIKIGYGDNNTSCDSIALEITLITGGGSYTVSREVADTGKILQQSGKTEVEHGKKEKFPIMGTQFSCSVEPITIKSNTKPKFLLVRTINLGTIVGFQAGGVNKCNNNPGFCSQGKYVRSTAKTPSGVTKSVQLYQSYPQLPADFFVTSF